MSKRAEIEETKFDAIIGADAHWRLGNPKCWINGSYIESLEEKLAFICKLTEKHDCPFLFSGDWFDEAKPVPEVLRRSMHHLPLEMIGIPGQHDLPQHNIQLFDTSGISLLNLFDGINISATPFGDCRRFKIKERKIGLLHRFTFQLNAPWPGAIGSTSPKLIKEFSDLDLLIIGDNHKPWSCEKNGLRIVNCGSMIRKTSDQMDYVPRVYGWVAETNTVVKIDLPYSKNSISDKHIVDEREINDKMISFVEGLETDVDSMGLNLEKNIQICMNGKPQAIKDCVWEIVGKAKGE